MTVERRIQERIQLLKREYQLERTRRKEVEDKIRSIQRLMQSDLSEENVTNFDTRRVNLAGVSGEFGEWQRKLARSQMQQAAEAAVEPVVEYDEEAARRQFENARRDFKDNVQVTRDTFKFC